MIYRCCDLHRRNLVAAHPTLNGIDYLEVVDRELPELDPLRQRTLLVHLLKPVPAAFTAANVRLAGGERVRGIAVQWAAPAQPLPAQLGGPAEAATAAAVQALPDRANVLLVRTAETGDFSTYTLSLAASLLDPLPPPDVDPRLASIDFGFKVECPTDFDCQPAHGCQPPPGDAPVIDYLARDYPSFRRLILDRLSQLVPQWQQSSIADTGVAVAELIAYAADQLSYQQDAVATEAYLGTARQRVSLRRHALLVDYPMHDGCNARAWLQLQVEAASLDLPLAGTQFLSRVPGYPTGVPANSAALDSAMLLAPEVYQPILDPRLAVQPDPAQPPDYVQTLYADHNRIAFYTWSDDRCCLAAGATAATLVGNLPHLGPGDVLLLEEVLGPDTGKQGDADRAHRHLVQLTSVGFATDPLTGQAVTEVGWAAADALPFPLCISGVTDEAHGAQHLDAISVARGNMVLVDHGQTITAEPLGQVPAPFLFAVADGNADRCDPQARTAIPPRYQPGLARTPMTQAAGRLVTTGSGALGTSAGSFASAAASLDWAIGEVVPQIVLDSTLEARTQRWLPERNLLNSSGSAAVFVAEIDDGGVARIRFGDDEHGERPDSFTAFAASYRVGNGAAGNVGADRIVHIVAQPAVIGAVSAVRNPCAASGGVDPESADSVRRNAPEAFRTQERAVTQADYAAIAERDAQVQRATAALRWTGSWYTVFVTPDPVATADPDAVAADLAPLLDRYRMAGHDLEFNRPHYVSLEIELHVCVRPDYFRSDVKQRLLQVLSNRVLPDGSRGLFHPDNFTFGGTVYLSRIYAVAHAVPGVASVQVTIFQRQGTKTNAYLLEGKLPLGAMEIARLDNDPNFPEHGVLRLHLDGGK